MQKCNLRTVISDTYIWSQYYSTLFYRDAIDPTEGSSQVNPPAGTLLTQLRDITPVALGRTSAWYATGRKTLAQLTCWPQQYLLGSRACGTFRPASPTEWRLSVLRRSLRHPASSRARRRVRRYSLDPRPRRPSRLLLRRKEPRNLGRTGRNGRKEGTLDLEERDAPTAAGQEGRQAGS